MFVAVGLGAGDEVICPDYTFFATVTPLLFTGAVPVLIDCAKDGNLDPKLAEEAITDRTRAIVVTHMWGVPADVIELRRIADTHKLLLLEDSSHAFGATVDGRSVGSFGDAAAMSLQGQKPLTGGEGGVLLTSNDELFYSAIAFGHYNVRCRNEIPNSHPLSRIAITGMGLKLRIHPLAAAIVEQQLDCFADIMAGRERIALRMIERLAGLRGLKPLTPRHGSTSSWYSLITRVDLDAFNGDISMNDIAAALHAEGASEVDRPGSTCPLDLLPLFQDPVQVHPGFKGTDLLANRSFREAHAFHNSIFKLPVWHCPEDDVIVDQYLDAFEKVWSHLDRHGGIR